MGSNSFSILNNSQNKQLCIFDFDGTLADTFVSGAKLINSYAIKFGYKQIDFSNTKNLSARQLIKLSKVKFWEIPRLVKFFRKKSEETAAEINLFSNIIEILHCLKKNGFDLAIASTNSQKTIDTVLKKYNIENMFTFLRTDIPLFGKKRALTRIRRYNSKIYNKLIYIGDEIRDIEACRKANIDIISVSWGFNSLESLQQHTKKVVSTPQELLETLMQQCS